jgi:hypothetical protein
MNIDLDNILTGVPKYIEISTTNKVSNPYHKGTLNKFYGNVENFDFNHQKKNYEELSKKLSEVDIRFDKVFSSTIERKIRDSIQYGITFIVTTTNPNIFWYKYEAQGTGSGGNHILIKGQKIKTTKFVELNKDDIQKLLIE